MCVYIYNNNILLLLSLLLLLLLLLFFYLYYIYNITIIIIIIITYIYIYNISSIFIHVGIVHCRYTCISYVKYFDHLLQNAAKKPCAYGRERPTSHIWQTRSLFVSILSRVSNAIGYNLSPSISGYMSIKSCVCTYHYLSILLFHIHI